MLGCIADDYTGGTDVAAALRRGGLTVVLLFGLPDGSTSIPACDAAVIALKTRSIPADQAIAQTIRAQRWLAEQGVGQFYFKYCSTFDSTDAGNIGPVADALLDACDAPLTLICPASPEHGRTVYQSHLFVADTLLSESAMREHPLTPMTDSNLVRVLGRQTDRPVGRIALDVVRAGTEAVADALAELAGQGVRQVVTDAVQDADLAVLARAAGSLSLLTGGAGLAGALALELAAGRPSPAGGRSSLPTGPGVVLAGSCSVATLAQVRATEGLLPSHRLDPVRTPARDAMLDTAREWIEQHWDSGQLMIYSSAGPADRQAGVAAMGPDTAAVLEQVLGQLAVQLAARGARRIVVAGGETSGAVVSALGVREVLVAFEATRGVPWCVTTGTPAIALLLKSGNFGPPELFLHALEGTGECLSS